MVLGQYKDCRNEIYIQESVGGYFPIYLGECVAWLEDGTPIDWYSEDFCLGYRFATKQEAIDYVETNYPQKEEDENYFSALREWRKT